MFVTASVNSSDSGARANASPPSNVRVRSFVVATGAVRLVRSGRRLVPENFRMTPSSLLSLVRARTAPAGVTRSQADLTIPVSCEAGSEGVEPPVHGFGDRDTTMA